MVRLLSFWISSRLPCIYKGVAKYTGDFVPASSIPDVVPDCPSGVSDSIKLTEVTEGCVHFDGNGDYLEATSSDAFAFGTGDFTIEAFVYATSLPNTNNRIIPQGADGSGDRTNFQIMVGSTGYVEFGHSSTVQTNAGLVGTNKWYHIAMTRSGTDKNVY